ncbi:MAG: transglutaminase-like domain-containing protein [Ignavibacteria bacterium]|nr:transglutaminase-like domain-containing protein [Ignavibacteria bacterium]
MSSNKLQYMLDLLDDDSLEIRDEIIKQLSTYGFNLEIDLREFSALMNEQKQTLISPILEENRRNWLEQNWMCVLQASDTIDRVEIALDLISKFQYGLDDNRELTDRLDRIADDFRNKIPYGDEIDLATFLFQEIGIKGDQENYYNPFNSNAIFALAEKKGNPITLCLIYAFVGDRLGFNIAGCNFPGHFLAKVINEDEHYLVDCFNGGKIIFESDVSELAKDSADSIAHIISEIPAAATIIKRILSNLSNSYSMINQLENKELFVRLGKML